MKLQIFSSSAFVFILISGLYCQQTFANTAPANINKGISDEEWKTIAGPKASETYSVVQGDTLYDISNRLFSDPRYWPKIWAMNNQNIKNPHKIYPGNSILFSPGSGSSLPSVAVKEGGAPSGTPPAAGGSPSDSGPPPADVHTSSDSNYQINSKRSTEWQRLPKQNWENYQFGLPGNVDALGFDRRSKVSFPKSSGFETVAIPASEKLSFLGEITGAKTESEYLGMGDIIYIKSVENLQIGNTYAVTGDPAVLKVSKTDRLGFSYLIMGKVKILSFRDKVYIGKLLMVNEFVSRGLHLIPNPARVPEMEPVPGVSPLRGALMIDHRFSTFTTAQYKEAFVNRGSEDGIKPGMIFRSYQHVDPSNNKKISDTDFVIEGDLIVTRVSENFSSVHVIRSSTPLTENTVLTLLTDVTDVTKNLGFNTRPTRDNVDDIDKLERGEKVDPQSKQELKQLEDWKNNPPPPGTDPSLPPPPDMEVGAEGESAPPPPPETPESMMTPPSAAGNEETPPAPPPPSDAGPAEAGAQELGTPPVDGAGGTPEAAAPEGAAPEGAAPEAASAPLPPAPATEEAPLPPVESSAEAPAEEAAPPPPSATAVNPKADVSPPASAAEPPLPPAQAPAAQAPAAPAPEAAPASPNIGNEPLPPPPPPSD